MEWCHELGRGIRVVIFAENRWFVSTEIIFQGYLQGYTVFKKEAELFSFKQRLYSKKLIENVFFAEC